MASGVTLYVAGGVTDSLDSFDRVGVLQASKMTIGQKVWSKTGANTTVASTELGLVRATSGTGDVIMTVPSDSSNIDMSVELRSTREIPSMAGISFRVNTGTAARYELVLRTDSLTPEYALVYLSGSTVQYIAKTGITPSNGDLIRITVLNHHCMVYVNRKLLIETDLQYLGSWNTVGLKFNGADLETSFSDFGLSNYNSNSAR